MFKPREKWFRGSIFFSLKSLLVRRGESWLADRGQRRPCSGNPGKGISMVSWNSSSLNNSSFPEGQETRFEREEKRRKSLLRRARTRYSYTQTLFLGERWSSLHPPCHQGWAHALTKAVEDAIMAKKNNKATTDIPNEMLKRGGNGFIAQNKGVT